MSKAFRFHAQRRCVDVYARTHTYKRTNAYMHNGHTSNGLVKMHRNNRFHFSPEKFETKYEKSEKQKATQKRFCSTHVEYMAVPDCVSVCLRVCVSMCVF